jgi:hypothetical protein
MGDATMVGEARHSEGLWISWIMRQVTQNPRSPSLKVITQHGDGSDYSFCGLSDEDQKLARNGISDTQSFFANSGFPKHSSMRFAELRANDDA